MPAKTYTVDDSREIPFQDLQRPPFAKINMWRESNNTHLLCYIDMGERYFEGTTTGVAIDASGSMQPNFGLGAFGQNKVKDYGQAMCAYIADKADRDGGTSLIYWATGDPGEIQAHGFLSADQARAYGFQKPRNYGRRTNLLPALKYFAEGRHPKTGRPFQDEKFGLFIIITDGYIEDLEPVKMWSIQLAKDIEAGKRNALKFIMIGVGSEINEQQMIELDDLDTDTNQDLYFHRIAEDMQDLSEIFIELVNANTIVAQNGSVKDSKGNVVLSFRDSKVPAKFEVDLPANAATFTLEIESQKFVQPLP